MANTISNKRIAKNATYLYIRMLIIMLVSLFTSRVVLSSLGVDDYGIYNVVGGIIGVFGFITGTLSTTTQRFITFELGKGDQGNVNKVFSTCFFIHLLIAVGIALVSEPIGLWLIYHKLIIPLERISAAIWVYQFTIGSMAIMFLLVPFSALIVAHERFNFYAIITIADVVLRLGVAYMVALCSGDKLIVYGLLLLVVQALGFSFYIIYCYKAFPELKIKYYKDKELVGGIGKFALWSTFGNVAYISYTQGLNLLLGAFFQPAVSAARAVAVQVQGAVNSFVTNFQTAINPQITKSYASGNVEEMITLVFRSSRFSYFLLLFVTIPLMLEPEIILRLWLQTVPDGTVVFVRIILATTWINSIANPLIVSVKASGRIKRYESIVGTIMILILPVSYIFLKLGYPPTAVFIIHLLFECIAMLFRIVITSKLIHFSLRSYFTNVLLKLLIVTLPAVLLPLLIQGSFSPGLLRLVFVTMGTIMSVSITVFAFGLTRSERSLALVKIGGLVKK